MREPHNMDAPDGPICGCGEPSRHDSGWCGSDDCENLRGLIHEPTELLTNGALAFIAPAQRDMLLRLRAKNALLEAQKAFLDRQAIRFGDVLRAAQRLRSRHLVTAAARLLAEKELDEALAAYERGESEAPRG